MNSGDVGGFDGGDDDDDGFAGGGGSSDSFGDPGDAPSGPPDPGGDADGDGPSGSPDPAGGCTCICLDQLGRRIRFGKVANSATCLSKCMEQLGGLFKGIECN